MMRTLRTASLASIVSDFSGVALLFVVFTTSQSEGIVAYLAVFLPFLVMTLGLLHLGRFPRTRLNTMGFLGLLSLLLAATISPEGLSKSIALFIVASTLLVLVPRNFAGRLPTLAYFAMIANIVIYFAEVILNSGLNLNFDPTVLNLIGAGRDHTVSTWQFTRFAGQHDEPGSLGTNLAGLMILSLLGGRRPTAAHWMAVLVLISTLSITSVIMAGLVFFTLVQRSGVSVRSVLTMLFAMILIAYGLFQILPNYGLDVVGYFQYRLLERNTIDGSIYVKTQLIDGFMNRSVLESIIGNRFAECSYCGYSKSLGFGFHVVFQSGIIGFLALMAIFFVAVRTYGFIGFSLALTLMLSRLDIYYPQVIFFLFAISQNPNAAVRSHRPVIAIRSRYDRWSAVEERSL